MTANSPRAPMLPGSGDAEAVDGPDDHRVEEDADDDVVDPEARGELVMGHRPSLADWTGSSCPTRRRDRTTVEERREAAAAGAGDNRGAGLDGDGSSSADEESDLGAPSVTDDGK